MEHEVLKSWTVCELGDVLLKMSNGANVTQHEEKVGYPICRIETIWNEGIDLGRVKYIKESAPEFVEKYALQYGDILLSHINSDSHLGKTGLFKNQVETLIHGINILLLRPVKNISPDFLNYQLKHLRTKGVFIDAAQRAVNQSSINQKKLKSFRIVIAPLPEQHRIVAKIEELFPELDKGIENLKSAQAQLKVYRQALLKHAFEGKLTAQWRAENQDKLETAAALQQRIQQERAQRYQQQLTDWKTHSGSKPKAPKPLPPLTAEELAELPDLPKGWGWVKFGELTQSSQNGISKRKGESGKDFIVLRLADIVNQRMSLESPRTIRLTEEEVQNYVLRKDELLCIRVNGSPDLVGRMVLVISDTEAAFCDHFIRFKLLSGICSTGFLRHYFDTHGIRRYVELNKVSSAGQNTVNQEMLNSALVAICGIEEQKVIVQLLEEKFSEVEQLDQTITTSLQQSEALRQSILKKAFSGQLVPQDPHDEPASVLLARIKAEKIEYLRESKTSRSKRNE